MLLPFTSERFDYHPDWLAQGMGQYAFISGFCLFSL